MLACADGTQGFQACQFPVEKRAEVAQLIGERAERLVYWTCAMERSTWKHMVLANKGLKQGETPVGDFSGRQTSLGREFPGVWPHPTSGPHALTGEEHWTLTAQEFTDMCAVQLSHVLAQANAGRSYASDDAAQRIMAEHLGGAALEQFEAELEASRQRKAQAEQEALAEAEARL